jgi:hypothetical protein
MRDSYTFFASYTSQTTGIPLTRWTKIITLWKIQDISETLNKALSKFYSSSKHLALDEVILFNKTVVFKQYIPKKHQCFGIIVYKLCDSTGYTCDMKVYLEKDKQHKAQTRLHSYTCCNNTENFNVP